MLAIRGASVHTPDRVIEAGVVITQGERIAAVGDARLPSPPEATVFDASGLILAPGFIDLQVNGGFGHDFTADPSTIWTVAAELPRYGVTAFLPTIITAPAATVERAQAALATGPPAGFTGARPLGLHIEGPFLNPAKRGAHNPAHLREPSLAAVADWSPERWVRLVTLAPELPGALDLIRALNANDVVVSAGHSQATFDEAMASFDAGIRYATHLFNAMPALHHREPGLAAAALADKRVTIGLIADGLHVHPALVAAVWRLAGSERLTLVTDCMAAMGMPPGEYVLGDFGVSVSESAARLDNGTLAGCVLSLDAIVRQFIDFTGCTLGEALPAVTSTPATVLGMDTERGRIASGTAADLVLLSPANEVVATFVAGRQVFGQLAGNS